MNPYTDYGEYSQTRYGYGDNRRKIKGSTTHIIRGRTPTYDVNINVVNGVKEGYPKGKYTNRCVPKSR